MPAVDVVVLLNRTIEPIGKLKKRLKRFVRRTYRSLRKHRDHSDSKVKSWIARRVLCRGLWLVDRQAMALGLSIGLAVAMLPPAPVQTLAATTLAILCRANIPLAVSAVWVSNPITWIPLLRFQEMLGSRILFGNTSDQQGTKFEMISSLTLGVVLSAALLAIISYSIFHCLWGIFSRKTSEES